MLAWSEQKNTVQRGSTRTERNWTKKPAPDASP